MTGTRGKPIPIHFSDLLGFLRREVNRVYPHRPDADLLYEGEKQSLTRFIDNPEVRAGIKDFCKSVSRDSSPEEISESLAPIIIHKRPIRRTVRFGSIIPVRTLGEPFVKECCRILGQMIHIYLDLHKGPLVPANKSRSRGRPKDKEVNERRGILHRAIEDPLEFRNEKKLRNLFGQLEREGIHIHKTNSTQWLQLLNDPRRKEELSRVISNLRKDLSR